MIWLLAYFGLGTITGVFAGLLGLGGGIVLVPVLALLFAAQGFPAAHLMHLALGTAMATIIFTSLSSLRAHHAHDAVLWPVVKRLSAGIVIGALLGPQLAARLPTRLLAIIFTLFMTYVAVQLLLDRKPRPSRELPGPLGLFGVGAGIGGLSALVSIGGGSLVVPFLVACNVRMHQAIGTSAATGLPIALAGTVGYVVAAHGAVDLPPGSFGFIHLPALLATADASVLAAPLGAKMAHRLPVALLKKIFAGLLLLLLAKMLHGLL
jgi:uncharacterized membrane protein YfcA